MSSTSTNADTITDEQIEALRNEAATHGDADMLSVCNQALANDGFATVRLARRVCAEAIADAQAQDDSDED